jgi:hypothetical protein
MALLTIADVRRRDVSLFTVMWEKGEGGPAGSCRRIGFEPADLPDQEG